MSYPKKEVVSDYGVISFIEMTPEEYGQNLVFLETKLINFLLRRIVKIKNMEPILGDGFRKRFVTARRLV